MTKIKPTLRRRIHGIMFRLSGMISCREFEDFVLAYLEDELTSTQRIIFEMHLKLCRECREYLIAYQSSLKATKKISQDQKEKIADVPEDLIKAILDARR